MISLQIPEDPYLLGWETLVNNHLFRELLVCKMSLYSHILLA